MNEDDGSEAGAADASLASVMVAPKDGGAPTVLSSTRGNGIATDGTAVYWTTGVPS